MKRCAFWLTLLVVASLMLTGALPALAAPSKAKYTQCLDACLSSKDLVASQAIKCVETCAQQTRTPAKITIKKDAGACYAKYDKCKIDCTGPVCAKKCRQGFIDCINGILFP